MTAFPWDAVMHAGLGLLRLEPDAFWRMSPREFAAACGALRDGGRAPARGVLDTLMKRYPDGGPHGQPR